jgi:peptidyl-prolyl cis-trans isomerase D
VTPTYEQARSRIEDLRKTELAQRQFGQVAEDFRNLVYEQADSLEPAAQKLGLPIQTAAGILRTPAAGATGALASVKFLAALFAPDSLEKKHNTDAIQTASTTLISGRVTKYPAAHARPFDEVKAEVRQRLTSERAADLARKDGAAKLAAWQAQPAAAADLPAAITLSRTEGQGQPPALIEAVMRVDSARLPQFVGVDLGAGGLSRGPVGGANVNRAVVFNGDFGARVLLDLVDHFALGAN